MSLVYRLKRLIKADAHAIVEGLEDPRWILAQAIRDMEAEIEKQAALVAAKKERLDEVRRQAETARKTIAATDADIELAMDEKREDIAKALIRKVIVNRRNLEVFGEQEGLLKKEIAAEEKELTAKKQSYDEVCSRAQTVSFPEKRDEVFHESKRFVEKSSELEYEVELEFLRRLKKTREARHEK